MKQPVKPLVVSHLTKHYGKYRGIEDLSFELEAGEVFGFLGPNGAGKTTTIRTVLDFIRPTSGLAKIFGLDSVHESVEAKRHIGFLAGDLAVYEKLSGKEFLTYLSALDGQVDWDFVTEMAARLKADLERPLHELSKGNRQKIGIIQALMHRPALAILDEPTSGLDPLMQEVFYELLREAREGGATVLISSHNLTEVQKICDRAAFIREGKLVSIEKVANTQSMNVHRFTVWFGQKMAPADFSGTKGLEEMTLSGRQANFVITGSVDAFIKRLAQFKVQNLTRDETTLEDIFMRYYKNDGGEGR